ncbi:hypothetical protein GN956_G6467 [Arapaima gigas]
MKRTGERFWKQNDSQGREESEALLKGDVEIPVRTTGGIKEELLKVLNIEVLLEDPSCLENEPDDDDQMKQTLPLVKAFINKNFPRLGVKSGQECTYFSLKACLDALLERIQGKDADLQRVVIKTFYHFAFTQLHHALQNSTTEDKILMLLHQGSEFYLCNKSEGCPNVFDQTSKPVDLLVLSDWVQSAHMKYLDIAQKVIVERLEKILDEEEKFRSKNIPEEEEDFIRLQLDVEQLLTGYIKRANTVSKVLGKTVQRVCYQELCTFLEKYVKSEMKHLKSPGLSETYSRMHQFRTFNTCLALKGCVEILVVEADGVHAPPVLLLGKMESVVLKKLLEEPSQLAKASLKKYFKNRDSDIEHVIEEVRIHLETFPQKAGQRAYKILVDMVYEHVASMYVRYMMLKKYKTLQRKWGDMGQRVAQDAVVLQRTFSQLNPEEPTLNNTLLLNVAEILQFSDVEALKLTGLELLKVGSPKLLQDLLHWRGGLLRREKTEVLKATFELSRTSVQQNQLWIARWWCCCC